MQLNDLVREQWDARRTIFSIKDYFNTGEGVRYIGRPGGAARNPAPEPSIRPPGNLRLACFFLKSEIDAWI
jgi:hypothetical protein